jgi:hypothetical protein
MLPITEGSSTLHSILGMLGAQFALMSKEEIALRAGCSLSYTKLPAAPGVCKLSFLGLQHAGSCIRVIAIVVSGIDITSVNEPALSIHTRD